MEQLIKQKRVRFTEPRQAESSSIRERWALPQQAESFVGAIGDFLGNNVQNWLQRIPWQMSPEYDTIDSEYATAVGAAAFAIYSLEQAEAEYIKRKKDDLEISRTKLRSKKEDTLTGLLPNSGRVTKRLSSKELKSGGETSTRSLTEAERKAQDSSLPVIRPGRSSSVRSMTPGEAKAHAWERVQLEKINKRYDKVKSSVLAWENEKKMQAKLKMEKKKIELERRRAVNQQHYQNKISRIEHIAGGARTQAEEERRKKESEIKQKAKKIGSRGNVPVKYCFCC